MSTGRELNDSEDSPDCSVCEDRQLAGDPEGWMRRMFIACQQCGNKRCPRGSWHEQDCTGSNEPGQRGSFYGPEESWPRPTNEEKS